MSSKTDVLSFDEWYTEAKKLNNDGFSAKDFFEAGQQSRQNEIDRIVGIISEAYKSGGNSSVETVYDKIQELLK